MNNTQLIASDVKCDDDDLQQELTKYTTLINEAEELISVAETQLAERHQSLLLMIKIADDEFKKRAVKSPSQPAESACDKTEEDAITNKELYKKIAQLTHPDKANNTRLFIKAKKALKSGKREELFEILTEAKLDYAEILNKKKQQYNELIRSEFYTMAVDWMSGDKAKMERIQNIYRNNLLNTLSMKQAML